MGHNLKVLLLEDRPFDAELIIGELQRFGFTLEWERVDNELDYRNRLSTSQYQIILADYSMPQFNAPNALRILHEYKIDIPFIVITGSISEEVAVDIIKSGAADYLLKDRLARLGQAILNALEQKRNRDTLQQAEKDLKRHLREMTALHALAAAGAEAVDENVLITKATSIIEEFLNPDSCGVLLVDLKSGGMVVHPSYIHKSKLNTFPPILQGVGITNLVIQRGTPFRLGDIRNIVGYFSADPDTLSELCVPIKLEDTILGCINIESHSLDAFSSADEQLFMTFAGQLATALSKTRLLNETKKRADHQTALNKIITAATQADFGLSRLLDVTLEETLQALSIQTGAIWLVSGEFAHRGLSSNFEFRTRKNSNTENLSFFETQMIEDYQEYVTDHSTQEYAQYMLQNNIHAAIATPLIVGTQQIGGFIIASDKPRRWTQEEVDLVESIAHALGGAVNRVQLFDEISQRAKELETISRLSAALRVATTREEMLPIILEHLQNIVNSHAVAMVFPRLSTSSLIIELSNGRWSQISGSEIPVSEDDLSHHKYLEESFISGPLMQFLPGIIKPDDHFEVFPLTTKNHVTGVMWIIRQTPFLPNEQRLITAICDLTANAVYRAALHDETLRRLSHLQILRKIDQTINSSTDLPTLLNALLDQITSKLGVDAACVLLFDPQQGCLKYSAVKGFKIARSEGVVIHLGESFAGQIASYQRPLFIEDITSQNHLFVTPDLDKEGFITYFGIPLIAGNQVIGALEIFNRSKIYPDFEWQDFLGALADQAAIAINKSETFGKLQQSNIELEKAYNETIVGWSRALDLRDKETEGHTQRVTEMSLRLARRLGVFSEQDLVHLRWGGLLHDIGKVGIPDSILLKPGPLTQNEWEIMRQHPSYAHDLLIDIEYLRPVVDVPYCHHEKWDGTGYPRGLRGEEIPLMGRVFALIDVWDALTSDRPYRPAWKCEDALNFLREQSGMHFDPLVVQAFFDMIDQEGLFPSS